MNQNQQNQQFQQALNQQNQQNQNDQNKSSNRRIVDHGNSIMKWFIERNLGHDSININGIIRPEASYLIDLFPPIAYRNNNLDYDLQTKFVHLSANKAKHAIHTVKWTPEGRRLLVASYSGEFTLWNGMTFNFETIMQAHDCSIFALTYSHDDNWLLSGDQQGKIKFWQPNFNNVNIIDAHPEYSIRDIAFSPNDSKFVSCSDDRFLKIWDFNKTILEKNLKGHNWDVKCCDWHCNLGLIVSGSKDNSLKLWDPRQSNSVFTSLGFKHNVTKTKFQPNGSQRLIASVSKDKSCRIFDLRMMADSIVIRSHEAELSCVAWHPIHSSMITTGGYDGSMNHYLLDMLPSNYDSLNLSRNIPQNSLQPVHTIPYAHEKAINCLEYHPLGHLLCSAGADRSARFWCRSRPNDPSAFIEPPYTNDKPSAWYYGINNNVNAVQEPTPQMLKFKSQLLPESGENTSSSISTNMNNNPAGKINNNNNSVNDNNNGNNTNKNSNLNNKRADDNLQTDEKHSHTSFAFPGLGNSERKKEAAPVLNELNELVSGFDAAPIPGFGSRKKS
ncbi:cleavage polyadenylation factor subunit PFS2 [Ascoidea rubescens DSM 1968]|uniref:Polyadenylation factor subunit 2 n=1 Tax=Ascoidea rubescens DSM 1968 TaxID=1344418 RepID=A0A1D2VHH1_9ASCO|nr:WD40 repeat-like protein [Ascoidea rubescens DSM 1968]ODV60953.1 WD40 repeat-like protein [Ascoidea rubescens DSM 1968]